MKNKYISFAIIYYLFLLYNSSFADFPFVKQRLMCDFKGIAYNQKSLLCYGTGAVVLRSDDKGDHWQQIYVADDKYTVKKIIFAQGAYFGILDSNYIISSFDEGNTWKLNLNEDSKAIIDFDFDGSKYFFLKNDRIAVYNDPSDKSFEILIDSSLHPKIIRVINDNIYLGCDSSKLLICNKSGTNENKLIDIGSSIDDIKKVTIDQIIFNSSGLFVRLENNIVKSEDHGLTWSKYNDKASLLSCNNDSLFCISSLTDYENNISYLYFFKLDSGVLTRLNNVQTKRYVSSQNYTDFKFISRDTIIAVGIDKLISISHDGGLSWEIICNLKKLNYCIGNWLNDSLGFLYTNYYQISKTTNGGILWLPQYYNYKPKHEFEFICPEVWFSDTSGFSIMFQGTGLRGRDNILFSNDFGENYYTVCDTLLDGYFKNNYFPSIIGYDSTYLLFYCIKGNNKTYTLRAELDRKMSIKNLNTLDSTSIVYVSHTENLNELKGIEIAKINPHSDGENDSTCFFLSYSKNNGMDWERIIKFKIDHIAITSICEIDSIIVIVSWKYDSLHHSVSSIDCIDYKNNKFYPMVYSDPLFIFQVIKLGDVYYAITSEQYFYKTRNILSNYHLWQKDSLGLYKTIYSHYAKRNCFYGIESYNFSSNILYKFIPKGTEGVEEQTEIKQPYFYAMYPYPLPGRNMISCHIFTSMDFDPANPDVKVYDLNGEMVSGGSAIEMTRTSGWEWDIKWNCTGLNDGIYVIALKDGDAIKTIRVMVAR